AASRRRRASAPPRPRPRTAPTRRIGGRSLPYAMNRPPRRLPRVVRRARPVRGRVGNDSRIAPDLLGSARMTEQVRIVALLPHEDQMRSGHELGHEDAAGGGTGEGVGADAEPPVVVVTALVGPQLLLVRERVLLEDKRPPLGARLLHAGEFSGARSTPVGLIPRGVLPRGVSDVGRRPSRRDGE